MNMQSIKDLRIGELLSKGMTWGITWENNQLLLSFRTMVEIPVQHCTGGISVHEIPVCIEMLEQEECWTIRIAEPDPAVVYLPNWSVSGELVCPAVQHLLVQPGFQLAQLVDFLLKNLALDPNHTFIADAVNHNAAVWYLDNHPDYTEPEISQNIYHSGEEEIVFSMTHRPASQSASTEREAEPPELTFVHRPRMVRDPEMARDTGSAFSMRNTNDDHSLTNTQLPTMATRRQMRILSVEYPGESTSAQPPVQMTARTVPNRSRISIIPDEEEKDSASAPASDLETSLENVPDMLEINETEANPEEALGTQDLGNND